jgi:hypothetical protein
MYRSIENVLVVRFLEEKALVTFSHDVFDPTTESVRNTISSFPIIPNEGPYFGLYLIHKSTPWVLPKLAVDLERYDKEEDLQRDEHSLLSYAIGMIRELSQQRIIIPQESGALQYSRQ